MIWLQQKLWVGSGTIKRIGTIPQTIARDTATQPRTAIILVLAAYHFREVFRQLLRLSSISSVITFVSIFCGLAKMRNGNASFRKRMIRKTIWVNKNQFFQILPLTQFA